MQYYIKDESFTEPEEDVYHVVAGNGVFKVRHTRASKTCGRIAKCSLPGLQDHEEYYSINYPLIPETLIFKIIDFFQDVYEEHKSEALILIMWNNDLERYELEVPDQKVSAWKVESEPSYKLLNGRMLIGDAHSHGCGGVGHSSIDADDEQFSAGIHFILGGFTSVAKSQVKWSCCLVVDGVRHEIENPYDLVDRSKDDYELYPKAWMDKVKYDGYGHWHGNKWSRTYDSTWD